MVQWTILDFRMALAMVALVQALARVPVQDKAQAYPDHCNNHNRCQVCGKSFRLFFCPNFKNVLKASVVISQGCTQGCGDLVSCALSDHIVTRSNTFKSA